MNSRSINVLITPQLVPDVQYVIWNGERSTNSLPVFWKADCRGYTSIPFLAGVYTAEMIKSQCDLGSDDIVIPLTNGLLQEIGFMCSFDPNKFEKAIKSINI